MPGGRTPEEREAARREREARRAGRAGDAAVATVTAPPPPAHGQPDDWLAEVEPAPSPERPDGGGRRGRAGDGGRSGPRWGRMLAAAITLAALAGVAWVLVSLFQPFKDDGDGRVVRVSVPQGATLGDIAKLLEEKSVISSDGFFELRARLAGRSGDLKPGSYEMREDMSYAAALDALERGVPPNITVVQLPEGLSRREIAPIVKQAGVPGRYLRASRRNPALDPRRYGAPRGRSLEGFLFPASYELRKGRPARGLVGAQLDAFRRNFDKVDLSYAKRRNLTAYDVLIIASLIEREAAVPKERRLVSSVIYNRLKNDISLGIDATVRFVTGNWTEPLKQSELANPSPYNTRVHAGLPPGPIGNPGLASIRAAANPARTGYLFYVAAVCGNGKHKFAETDAEFQRYVDEYNAAREERGGKSPTNC
ncbi:MAG: endolytic transglycosylase MltG [Thermoleophilaceae bacterium]